MTPIKTLVAAALLAPPAALYRMHLDVAALCEIDWYADGPAVLRSFNDTAHLSQLGLVTGVHARRRHLGPVMRISGKDGAGSSARRPGAWRGGVR